MATRIIYVLTNGNVLYSSDLYSYSHSLQSWTSVFNANGTTTNDMSIINGPVGPWLAGYGKGIYKSDANGANWAFHEHRPAGESQSTMSQAII